MDIAFVYKRQKVAEKMVIKLLSLPHQKDEGKLLFYIKYWEYVYNKCDKILEMEKSKFIL